METKARLSPRRAAASTAGSISAVLSPGTGRAAPSSDHPMRSSLSLVVSRLRLYSPTAGGDILSAPLKTTAIGALLPVR